MRRSLLLGFLGIMSLTVTGSAGAAGYNWNFHSRPYTWLFGNHIDTHQQQRLNSNGTLSGFFFVYRLDLDSDGVPDTVGDNIPLYGHCTMPEDYPTCQAGWTLRAYPCIYEVNGCTAMFLYHKHDHPVWLIGPNMRTADGDTFLDGDRNQIPQPGRPTHFHWLTESSTTHGGTTLPSSIADVENLFGVDIYVDPDCNVSTAEELTPGVICPGYFLELTVRTVISEPPTSAGAEWAFRHGGKDLLLLPGPDMRTHINYVTSFVPEPVPTDSLPYPPPQ
jgi:hypothetical protein